MADLALVSASSSSSAAAGAPVDLAAVGDEEPLVSLAPPPPAKRQLTRRATEADEVTGTQQADSLAAAGMVECVFDCGPPRHVSTCTNTGTHAHPRWMCKGCNGASRALDLAARNSGHFEELKEMKKRDPEAYKAKIRQCRVRSSDDPPGTHSLRDNKQRAAAFSTYLQGSLTQSASLENRQKRRFLG